MSRHQTSSQNITENTQLPQDTSAGQTLTVSSFQAWNHCFEAQQPWRGGKCKGTPSPRLQSDPVADPILLCNIGSYSHHSESTLLPPNILSLFRPWLPMQGHEDTVVYNVDYSLQEPHLIL